MAKPAQHDPLPTLPGLPELPAKGTPPVTKTEARNIESQGPPQPLTPLESLDKQTIELLNQIKSQAPIPNAAPAPPNPAAISPVTPVAGQGLPPIEILPPTQAPLQPQAPLEVAPGTAPLQRIENSPWMLQMEIVSGQTLLIAKLRKQVEFKIMCDRVEMKAPGGAVQAVGKVSVSGSGLKGTCDRLTLPLAEDRMLLEGKAEVSIEDQAGSPASPSPSQRWELRGEQLNVRLSQLPALQGTLPAPKLMPASLLEPAPQK